MTKRIENKTINLIIIIPVVFFIITSFMISWIYIYQEQIEFEKSIKEYKKNNIESKKELIKEEVQRAIVTIKYGKFVIKKYKVDEKIIQKRLLDKISKIRFGKYGYILFLIIMV